MTLLNENKKKFREKVREYKTEIIIAGVAIASVTAAILISRNWNLHENQNTTNLLKGYVKAKSNAVPLSPVAIQNTVISSQSDGRIIEVSRHIRNLPEGWSPSHEKLSAALSNGIELTKNQTWVEKYPKISA